MKYSVILADPPWSFKAWKGDKGSRTAESYYDIMPTEQLFDLEVPAADNCALFLWSTWATLPEAFWLINAWGFEYKTVAWAWVKQTSKGNPHFGMGHYTRGATEPCLLGIKGRMPVKDKGVIARIDAPVREHSRKPDEQYEKIERLYPDVPKLEMFARYEWPNWDSWGNEVKNSVDLNIDPSGVQQE